MLIQTRYSFFPVGQGTFSGGALELAGENNLTFRWVYDCGSVKTRQPQLISEIERLALLVPAMAPGKRPRLDLVFVSHFDQDHVSGLLELLSRFDVTTLVLPLIPLWQRLALAVSAPQAGSPRIREFLVDPLGFVASISGILVSQVYLVPPSASTDPNASDDVGDEPTDQPLDGIMVLKPSRVIDLPTGEGGGDVTLVSLDQLPFALRALAPGGKLVLGSFWEFVPYNEPKLKIKATPTFRAAVTRVASALLNASHSKRARILVRLKRVYDRTYGKRPKQRNRISLFVFAGPIGRHTVLGETFSRFPRALSIPKMLWSHPCWAGQCDICSSPDMASSRAGILYTGDGYLNSVGSFNDLRNYLGRRRLGNLRVLQVMHHGSRANWHRGLAAKLSPISSVYCADPKYVHRHPHTEVKNDFIGHGPQLVNWESGYTSFQTLEW